MKPFTPPDQLRPDLIPAVPPRHLCAVGALPEGFQDQRRKSFNPAQNPRSAAPVSSETPSNDLAHLASSSPTLAGLPVQVVR